jgi:hypothetical protein
MRRDSGQTHPPHPQIPRRAPSSLPPYYASSGAMMSSVPPNVAIGKLADRSMAYRWSVGNGCHRRAQDRIGELRNHPGALDRRDDIVYR